MQDGNEDCKESYKETDAEYFAGALEALTLIEITPLSPAFSFQLINGAFKWNIFGHATNLTGAILLVKALCAARIRFRFEVFSIGLLESLKGLLDQLCRVTARHDDLAVGDREQALRINLERTVNQLQI